MNYSTPGNRPGFFASHPLCAWIGFFPLPCWSRCSGLRCRARRRAAQAPAGLSPWQYTPICACRCQRRPAAHQRSAGSLTLPAG
jgi:hypothetical protein